MGADSELGWLTTSLHLVQPFFVTTPFVRDLIMATILRSPKLAGICRDCTLLARLTAMVPLLAFILPFIPESLANWIGFEAKARCDTLAKGLTFASIYLVGHKTIFVINRAVPQGPTWLGQAWGAALMMMFAISVSMKVHGTSEVLICATSAALAVVVSLTSEVFVSHDRSSWIARQVLPELISLVLIIWAMVVIRMPHFHDHASSFVVSTVAGVLGFHWLTYVADLPNLRKP